MENIDIKATARTPKLLLDTEKRLFVIEGESYPEDTKKFYDQPIQQVCSYLEQPHDAEVVCQFKLKYFNSSTAKVLMDLFTTIDGSASKGNPMKVEWHFVADDDNMRELGEEFSEELSSAAFELVPF